MNRYQIFFKKLCNIVLAFYFYISAILPPKLYIISLIEYYLKGGYLVLTRGGKSKKRCVKLILFFLISILFLFENSLVTALEGSEYNCLNVTLEFNEVNGTLIVPEALYIGDRLSTDILAGINAGIDTVLVKTGISDYHMKNILPTVEIDSIVDIFSIL